jgi:catechol 2,3-dioxygenase-like lactoylglutathione lyase family enzyme
VGIARPTTVDTTSFGIHPPTFRLPATARIGRVRLAVSQLARSVHFYSEVIGLAVPEIRFGMVDILDGTQKVQTLQLVSTSGSGFTPGGVWRAVAHRPLGTPAFHRWV